MRGPEAQRLGGPERDGAKVQIGLRPVQRWDTRVSSIEYRVEAEALFRVTGSCIRGKIPGAGG